MEMIIYDQICCKINSFPWPLEKLKIQLKIKFLIDFHVKTLKRIFWHPRKIEVFSELYEGCITIRINRQPWNFLNFVNFLEGIWRILNLQLILINLNCWLPPANEVWGKVTGGVPGPGGAWSRGSAWSEGCLVETPTPPPGTASAAGGTHPIGMHSCLKIISLWSIQIVRTVFKPVKLIFS